VLNDLGDALVVVINRNSGSNKDSRMATTGVVSKLDGDQLVTIFVGELAIRRVLDVGDELLESVDVLSEVHTEIDLVVI
jgi:hypothetical protein